MSKIVCPYCFETFKRNEVMFRCSNELGCQKGDDSELRKFWFGRPQNVCPSFKSTFSFGSLFGSMPDSAKCPKCGEKSYWVICPHCHNRIPKQMVKKKGYIISIIGARSSGKTIYITTLINELIRYGHCLGISITASAVAHTPENNTQRRYERDFFNILYKENQMPAQTNIQDERNKEPLIYELGQKGKSSVFLVFYDTAGENFIDPKNIGSNVKYLNHSDAIIYLLDTFAIPYVHEKLKAHIGLSNNLSSRFDTILTNVFGHFDEGDEHIKSAHYSKPMALVFSKIDAILKNDSLFQNTALDMSIENNSSFLDNSGVNLSDIDSNSNSIETALRNFWDESNFVGKIDSHYKNHKYFGISALGSMPDKSQSIHNLRPYRVLDPLVWILHKLNYSLPIVK